MPETPDGADRAARALDLLPRALPALSGGALILHGIRRRSLLGAAEALLGGTLVFSALRPHRQPRAAMLAVADLPEEPAPTIILVEHAVTVDRPAAELYAFWRRLENLPQVMEHLEAVHALSNGRSHWVARAPLGTTVTWDAEIVEDREPEAIAWQSLPGADVPNRGRVSFAPALDSPGTVVTVALEYEPPGGAAAAAVAALLGEEPRRQIADALERFKRRLESGEIAAL